MKKGYNIYCNGLFHRKLKIAKVYFHLFHFYFVLTMMQISCLNPIDCNGLLNQGYGLNVGISWDILGYVVGFALLADSKT